jgi:hypothetical protein
VKKVPRATEAFSMMWLMLVAAAVAAGGSSPKEPRQELGAARQGWRSWETKFHQMARLGEGSPPRP